MIKIFSDDEQLLRIHSDCKKEDSLNLDSRSELDRNNSRMQLGKRPSAMNQQKMEDAAHMVIRATAKELLCQEEKEGGKQGGNGESSQGVNTSSKMIQNMAGLPNNDEKSAGGKSKVEF